jgi:hypothetical protein
VAEVWGVDAGAGFSVGTAVSVAVVEAFFFQRVRCFGELGFRRFEVGFKQLFDALGRSFSLIS